MKIAASIYLGGQFIYAEDANYDSYKDLGLVCPHCKSPVFFQAKHYRSESVKLDSGKCMERKILVRSQFKHFKAKDPTLVKICEARVAKYDKKEIYRQATRARNQRLKIFQNHFWKLFQTYYEQTLDFPVSTITDWAVPNTIEDKYNPKNIAILLTDFFYINEKEDSRALVKEVIDTAFNGKHIMVSVSAESEIGVSISSEIQFEFFKKLRTNLDKELQYQIALEIVDFLHLKSSRPLVDRLFLLATWVVLDSMADGSRLGFKGASLSNRREVSFQFWDILENKVMFYTYCHAHLLVWLSLLPWSKVMPLVLPTTKTNK